MRFDAAQPIRRPPSLTSLIDVVFLLLIFFMLATRFGVESQLPLRLEVGVSAAAAEAGFSLADPAAQGDAVVIRLDDDGGTWLSGERIDSRALASGLFETLRSQPSKRVLVTPDDSVSVQRIVDALRDASQAGASVVSLAEVH